MKLNYFEMRCKFAGYNIEGLDDCIEIVEGTLKVCSIYVHDNIINKIIIYVNYMTSDYVRYYESKHSYKNEDLQRRDNFKKRLIERWFFKTKKNTLCLSRQGVFFFV